MVALRRALVRWHRLACVGVTLLAIMAPAALGPALRPLLDELGESGHVCKCGMKPGTCGCPECERAEHERLSDRRSAAPLLRGHCDQDARMTASTATPLGPLPQARTLLPVPLGERTPPLAVSTPVSDRDLEPPTPPPRLATV